MADKEFINKWTDIVKEYLPKWDKTFEHEWDRSKDINRDINGFIKWLQTHENKPELHNFVYGVLPYKFVRYLYNNKVITYRF